MKKGTQGCQENWKQTGPSQHEKGATSSQGREGKCQHQDDRG